MANLHMWDFYRTYSLPLKVVQQTNVLIDQHGSPRLCDFGRSKIISQQGYIGAAKYLAPELLSSDEDEVESEEQANMEAAPPSRENKAKKCDIYAFGMVALEVGSLASPILLSPIDSHSL